MDIRPVHQDLKPEEVALSDGFEQAPICLAIVRCLSDGELSVLSANRTFRTLLGGQDAMAQGLRRLLTPTDYERLQSSLKHQAPPSLEVSFGPSHGRRFTCELSASRLNQNDEATYILVLQDTTARKAWEEHLLETAGMEQREDFIATLTHDLKTPIVGANMVLTALLDGTLGEMSEQQREIIGKLRTSNQAQLKMIQNLLEVYRYESGTDSLTLDTVNLCSVIKLCEADVRPLVENKSLTLTVNVPSKPLMAVCDPYALQRVLVNLLGNAIKFTPTKGLITIEMLDEGDHVMLKVTDTGSGINPDDQRRLFQRFWQGESGKRYAAGTGLGLYFCSHVVSAHGGEIICESSPGVGSTFLIKLPKTPPTNTLAEEAGN